MSHSIPTTYLQNNKEKGPFSCLSCHASNYVLSANDPAYQYQTQKIIQNTVRVHSSLYTDNKGSLASFQPLLRHTGVQWNQMSDRAVPHFQRGSGGSQGSSYHGSSLRRTQTGMRPGAQTPGGYGVDIKHNSYARRLNRLKGGKLYRRGPIPSTFGVPLPFSRASPVYGGKTIKTAIVSSCPPCVCSDDLVPCEEKDAVDNQRLYRIAFPQPVAPSKEFVFTVGQKVYARTSLQIRFTVATIEEKGDGDFYRVKFEEDGTVTWLHANLGYILPYFPCNCLNSFPNTTNFKVLAFKYWFRDCFALAANNEIKNLIFLQDLYPLVFQFSNFIVPTNFNESQILVE